MYSGEGGLLKSLENAGIKFVDKEPDFVVLGEGHEFTLKMVHQAVDMILAGAKFIATNRDPSPRKAGWNNLGIGATAAMIAGSQWQGTLCHRQTEPGNDALGS